MTSEVHLMTRQFGDFTLVIKGEYAHKLEAWLVQCRVNDELIDARWSADPPRTAREMASEISMDYADRCVPSGARADTRVRQTA